MSVIQGKRRKSPLYSRILSWVIPGCGHFYSKKYFKGFLWFFISGLLIISAKYFYQHRNDPGEPWESSRWKRKRKTRFLIPIGLYFYTLYACANSAAYYALEYNSRRQMDETYQKGKSML